MSYSDYALIKKSTLTEIGDAIRTQKGTTGLIDPANYADEINSIISGGEIKYQYNLDLLSLSTNNNARIIGEMIGCNFDETYSYVIPTTSTTKYSFNPGTNTWEICIKVRYESDYSGGRCILGNTDRTQGTPTIEIQEDGYIWFGISTTGNTWEHGQKSTKRLVSPNQWYYIKLNFTGTQYILTTSIDGVTIENQMTISTSDVTFIQGQMIFGNMCTVSNIYFRNGEIDFKETYIKISDEIVWGGFKL